MLYTQSPPIARGCSIFMWPPFPLPSSRSTAKTPQVVETCHNGTNEKKHHVWRQSRQAEGRLRSTVALKITSSWMFSELKTMPISFSSPLAGIKERKRCSSVTSCCWSARLSLLDVHVQQVEGFTEGKQTWSKQFCISCGCHDNCGYLVFWVVSRPYHGQSAVSCIPQPLYLGSASPRGRCRGSPPGGRSLIKREILNCSCCAGPIKMKPSLLINAHWNFRHTFPWNRLPCFFLSTQVLQARISFRKNQRFRHIETSDHKGKCLKRFVANSPIRLALGT